MKKRVIFIRFLSFGLLFLLLFYMTTELLKDKRVELEYDVTAKVKGFYAEPDDSLDFVFIGSSQLYADIAPNVLFSEYGITSYDFCANEQPLWISYYYMKEALKHQSPKAIVLDVFTVYGDTYEDNGVNHINLDDLPWNLNKLEAIRNGVKPEERMEFYFELIRYHDTWAQLDKNKIKNTFYHEKNVYKGYSPFVVAHDYESQAKSEVLAQKERQPIPERALVWLDKIVRLTRKEDVDLILIKTPNGSAERQMLYNSVEDYAKKENVPFLNMNTIFDWEAHINILQAEKVTKYLGEYLLDKYEVTDKRTDEKFASWHEDSRYFYHKKDKCRLISTTDALSYMTYLKDTETIKMIAVKCDSAHPVTDKTMKLLEELGIRVQKNKGNATLLGEESGENMLQTDTDAFLYLAMLDEKNHILLENHIPVEQVSPEEGADSLTYQGHEWNVAYDAQSEKKQTILSMDGDNYSFDQYGINLFVYDPLLEEIVEFVYFAAEDEYALVRE